MCKLSVEKIKKHNFFVNRNTTKTQFQEDSNNYDFKTAMQSYTLAIAHNNKEDLQFE